MTKTAAELVICERCGHLQAEHGQERAFYECDESRREVCLRCPGYEEPGYPNGDAWHRFKEDEKRRKAMTKSSAQIIAQDVTEAQVQATVRDMAVILGWTVFLTWKSLHSPKGELDLRLIKPPRYVLIECKTEKGKLTPEQTLIYELLRQCPGVEVYVARPSNLEEIRDILQR